MKALIAVDLTHEPERIVDMAGRWAARFGARADIAYTNPVAAFPPLVHHVDFQHVAEMEMRRMAKEDRDALTALIARLPEPVRGEVHRWEGQPAEAIAEHSRDYDVIMTGTHDRRGVSHLVLGSVAERVVRWSHTPTLVMRGDPREGPLKVACAVDMRDRAPAIVARAVDYADRLNAVLDLVHVEDLSLASSYAFDSAVQALFIENIMRCRTEDEKRLQEMIAHLPEGRRGRAIVEDGDPALRLAAIGADYDLVLIATHGRTGLDRWWLGSVAEGTVRRCTRSVLVFPLGDAA